MAAISQDTMPRQPTTDKLNLFPSKQAPETAKPPGFLGSWGTEDYAVTELEANPVSLFSHLLGSKNAQPR